MTVKQMYERVALTAAVSEREFFNRLNDTIEELCALYGEPPKLLWEADENGEYPSGQRIRTFEADKNSEGSLKILPLYHNSMVDNILYLSGGGDAYKSEFLRKAREAWLKYWNANAKGRRVKFFRCNGACGCDKGAGD